MARGRGTVLAKFYVEGAFQTVPVHPDDQWLLCMRWGGQVYVDKVPDYIMRAGVTSIWGSWANEGFDEDVRVGLILFGGCKPHYTQVIRSANYNYKPKLIQMKSVSDPALL